MHPTTGNFSTGYYNNITVNLAGFIDLIKGVDFDTEKRVVEAQIKQAIEMIPKESKQLTRVANNFSYPNPSSGAPSWPLPNEVLLER